MVALSFVYIFPQPTQQNTEPFTTNAHLWFRYIYLGVLGASFLGATFGSLAREKCPKELLLFLCVYAGFNKAAGCFGMLNEVLGSSVPSESLNNSA